MMLLSASGTVLLRVDAFRLVTLWLKDPPRRPRLVPSTIASFHSQTFPPWS
jgi:hypothetical protein